MTYIWGLVALVFLIGLINHIVSGENDESSVKGLNIDHGWKRNNFDPDTYEPSSLHGDKYNEDE
jgi:hypothetical protein